MRKLLYSALALVICISAPGGAFADSLTRASCWSATFTDGGKRRICFFASQRVKLTNYAHVTGSKAFSTCRFSGTYTQRDADVQIAIPANSDKCTNGALSPDFSATCLFSGESLSCKSSTTVAGKKYDFDEIFR